MSTTANAHRGLELPAPGTWVIDPSHSSIEAVARHLVFSKVRGRFGEFQGAVHVAEDPAQSWAEATITAASIDSGDATRDGHLRSPDFLDAEKFKELTFRSTSFQIAEDGSFVAEGDLTIRGVTRPVSLGGRLEAVTPDLWGNARIVLSARGEIDREEFGMTWNQALESGGVLVGKKLAIELEVQAVKQ